MLREWCFPTFLITVIFSKICYVLFLNLGTYQFLCLDGTHQHADQNNNDMSSFILLVLILPYTSSNRVCHPVATAGATILIFHHSGKSLALFWRNLRLSDLQMSTSDLTHWGRDKLDAISQTTLSNAFSWMTMLEFRVRYHWSLFPRDQLSIFQHWFR